MDPLNVKAVVLLKSLELSNVMQWQRLLMVGVLIPFFD